ncbi:MAG: hypothetical protein V8R89_05820 [Alphaproteobacteria bacterium]|jgi:hypothetical protein
MTNNEIKVIEKTVGSNSQASYCIFIYQIQGKIIKLKIYADDVDFQSYAKAWLFDKTEWKQVYNIPAELMKTKKNLAYQSIYYENRTQNLSNNIKIWNNYKEDLDKLKQKAESIILGI